jgi:hypothetical protein
MFFLLKAATKQMYDMFKQTCSRLLSINKKGNRNTAFNLNSVGCEMLQTKHGSGSYEKRFDLKS